MELKKPLNGKSLNPFTKKIKFYVTEHCNEACVYCPIHDKNKKLTGETLTPEFIGKISKEAIELGFTHIKLSGEFGDPLFRKDILEVTKQIAQHHPEEISVATNGLLLPEKASELIDIGVNKFCISLDTLDESKYKSLTGKSGVEIVKEAIMIAAKRLGKQVKVNMVVMKGINENEINDIRKWVQSVGASLQLIELYLVPGKESFYENHHYSLEGLANKYLSESNFYEVYKPRKMVRYFMPSDELLEVTSFDKYSHWNFGNLRLLVHPNGDLGNYDIRKTGINVVHNDNDKLIKDKLNKASNFTQENLNQDGTEPWIYGIGLAHFVS